jgi:hypothetical protein
MIIGGVTGALLGVGAAYLYLQSTSVNVDEDGQERLPSVQPGKAISATLGVLTAVRQVVGLGHSE